MQNNKKMEAFINLTKYDTVVPLDEKILPGSLVFDSLNPFPGYYHEDPMAVRPIYLYLVMDKQYTLERVLRASQSIARDYSWDFDAGKGYMSIGSEFLNVIRVRHLPDMELVDKIQEAYMKHNINFLMHKKLKGKLVAEVKVTSFATLDEIGDGIYLKSDNPEFGFIEVPKYLNSEAFAKVAMDVKYNWDGPEFDAARGSFYSGGKLHEMVRILSSKNDLEYLTQLRKLYIDKIG